MSADMTRAQELRERLRDEGVTVTARSDEARAIALLRHRRLNAHYADDELRIFPNANVGLAVATERGLLVPVLREAERKSLVELAASARRSSSGRARASSPGRPRGRHVHDLEPRDVRRRAVHRRPQPAAGRDPRGRSDRAATRLAAATPSFRPLMSLTLTCDHRAADGAEAAEFLRT